MKRLLMVIDYQVDFVSGSLGFPRASLLEDPICQKIQEAKARGDIIVYTMDTHENNYLSTLEGKNLPIPHCIRGTAGWNLYGKVNGLLKDTRCFVKNSFGCAQLIPYLQKEDFEEVELCGLVSNICVLSNAVLVKAALPQAQVIVDAKCTDCADTAKNQEALNVLEGLQVKVLNRK
ncbi:MAG: cysteine hydrolase [Oscillospiraceae bacterium]|jgi:nicotinamidase-related amidase|nr:cysteine hydrolase [Oscillospiraceae bacterium]